MKKLFSLFAAVLFAGSMMMFADTQTRETVKLSTGSLSNGVITWNAADGKIAITQNKGTSSTAVNGSYIAAPRVYKGHYLAFAAETNYLVDSVYITFDGNYKGNSITAGIAVANNVVTDNTTAVSRDLATVNGGTHTFGSAGVSNLYIQNVASDANVQLRPTAIVIVYTKQASTVPAISCGVTDLGLVYNAAGKSKVVAVEGENLTAPIEASLEIGTNFSVSGTLTAEGGNLTITLTATAEGTYTDNLVLTSGSVTETAQVKASLIVLEGAGTQANPYSVTDVRKLNNAVSEPSYVQGVIVGAYVDNVPTPQYGEQATNIAIAKGTDTIPVQLPTGDIRSALNLVDNPTNLGKEVIVKGSLEAYFNVPGVKSVSEYEFYVPAPVIEPADRRICAYELKSVLNGDNYKFSYKSNVAGSAANLIFYNEGVEAGRVVLDAPVAGLNEYTMSKLDLPAGTLTWAIEVKAGVVENYAEFTDASRGIYDFFLPQGVAVNNCTESDYFGHMYITEIDGVSEGTGAGGCDRTKYQQGGIFEYDLLLNELNPTNQGWMPAGVTAGADRQDMKRISVDESDGMVYFNRTDAIYKMNPSDMTAGVNILAGAEGITKVNACYAEDGVVYFMDNANTSTGGTLKKIAADGTISTIAQSGMWGVQDMGICGDGRGGLWLAQHRWNIDGYSILTHVTSEGVIDFSVTKNSDDAVKALFPQNNNASYRGQLAYFAEENLLAFGGNKTAAVYKVTYDAESGVPSLELKYRSGTIGGNLDGFSFDYAGNLYFLSASVERLYAYSVPTENNEVIVPAKSTLKVSSTATAIDNNLVAPKVEKIFRNGQVLIIKDGKAYNMMGQIVR